MNVPDNTDPNDFMEAPGGWQRCFERPKVGDYVRPNPVDNGRPYRMGYGEDGSFNAAGPVCHITGPCFLTDHAKVGGEILSDWEVWTGEGPPSGAQRQP